MAGVLLLDDIRELSRLKYGTKGETYFVNQVTGLDTNNGKRSIAGDGGAPLKNIWYATQLATDGDTIVWDGEHEFTDTNPALYDTGLPGFDRRTSTIPAGVKFIGGSRSTARIKFQGSPIKVALGGNAILSDFTLIDVSAPGSFVQPIGWTPLTPGPSTGVEVHRIRVVADSDGTYHSGSAAQAISGYWKYFDSIFETKYDAHTILGDLADQQVDYLRCQFFVRGPSTVSPTTICRSVTAQNGVTRLRDCLLSTESASLPTTYIAPVYARRNSGNGSVSRIELYNCYLKSRVYAGFVGTHYHIDADAGCEVLACNTSFSPTLVNKTAAGSILYQNTGPSSGPTFSVKQGGGVTVQEG